MTSKSELKPIIRSRVEFFANGKIRKIVIARKLPKAAFSFASGELNKKMGRVYIERGTELTFNEDGKVIEIRKN